MWKESGKNEKNISESLSFLSGAEKVSFLMEGSMFWDTFYPYALWLMKNTTDAEDLIQNAWIKIWTNISNGKYTEKGSPEAWIRRIMHNLAIDFFREKNKKRLQFFPGTDDQQWEGLIADDAQPLIEEADSEERKNLLGRVLRELTPVQKEVVSLRAAGMSFKEIAEETNVSINTAIGRSRYAEKNARKEVLPTDKVPRKRRKSI